MESKLRHWIEWGRLKGFGSHYPTHQAWEQDLSTKGSVQAVRQLASLLKLFALPLAFVVEHLMRQLMSPEDTEISAAYAQSAQSAHLNHTKPQPRHPCRALNRGRTFPLMVVLESSHEEAVMLLWVVIHFQWKVKTQSGQDSLKSQLKPEVETGQESMTPACAWLLSPQNREDVWTVAHTHTFQMISWSERWDQEAGLVSLGLSHLRNYNKFAAATAAKSLQSCPTLCDPIDGNPPGSSVPGILQARTLEWVAISFSNAWKWKMKVKSVRCVRLLATPRTAAYQAPASMGFSGQEYWSGLPLMG